MTMIFNTVSGSIYEVDETNKRIRRLEGKTLGTVRVGNDGDWKRYSNISEIKVGRSIVIVWGIDYDGGEYVKARSTITSSVESVSEGMN
jgi:hypothetical protein